MDVSIIIVNYNTKTLTQQCIDSVFDKTLGLSYEVILVDNASTDGSKEWFVKDKRIKYIYSDVNVGFGRANNLGYDLAKGDYLFLLNSDTYLMNNAIFLLWKGIKEENEINNNVACAGTMLLDADGTIIHSYANFPSMRKIILNASINVLLWKLHILKSLPSSNNYRYANNKGLAAFDVDYITGADLMIKRTVADSYGLFDPDFFMYYEESEMEHRYMKQGFRRIIIQGPEIVHLEGKSNAKHSPKRTTMVMRGQFAYFRKTSSPLSYGIFKVVYKTTYLFTQIICLPFVHGNMSEKLGHLIDVFKMK